MGGGLDRWGATTAPSAARRWAGPGCVVRLGQWLPPQQRSRRDHLGRVLGDRRCRRRRVLAGAQRRAVRLASRTGDGPVATAGARRWPARPARRGAVAGGDRVGGGVGRLGHRHRAARIPPHHQRAVRGVPPLERAAPPRLDARRDRLCGGARPPAVGRPRGARGIDPAVEAEQPRFAGWAGGIASGLRPPQPVGTRSGRRCCCRRTARWASCSGSGSWWLPSSVDLLARCSAGRVATAEEFARFISTSPAANVVLMVAWVFGGYHLFAR